MKYEPLKLTGERVWRTYIGGRNIDSLQKKNAPADSHFPEEWMFSVTRAFNAGREELVEGLCCLEENPQASLKDLIAKDPEGMLGKTRVEQWGLTLGILIKIIDSAERLTIQVHPDKNMAEKLFHSRFGKTECWYILGTRNEGESPCLYMGFKEEITRELWKECFDNQDYEKMLSLMNRIEVKKGETYLVRGGMPHAIGAGCILIEIQEPTDLTIRVEKVTPSGFTIDDRMCHQGIGFENMFDCFDYTGRDEETLRKYCCIPPKKKGAGLIQLVNYEDTPCFRMEEETVETSLDMKGEGEFVCLYVIDGEGLIQTEKKSWDIEPDSQFFIPADCGSYRITAKKDTPVRLLKLYGPEL